MSKFRHLPKSEMYVCRECDKFDSGNYFISETLCKKCAAQRRRHIPISKVKLSNNIVITTYVKKQLMKKAEGDVPRIAKDLTDSTTLIPAFLICWILALTVADSILSVVIWLIVAPFMISAVASNILSVTRKTRVESRMLELAEERQQKIQEREQFYASPEWKLLRDAIVQQQGKLCSDCGIKIPRSIDVTVDHILPRSKYPELALKRSNLRVLCRSCNSRKGDRTP